MSELLFESMSKFSSIEVPRPDGLNLSRHASDVMQSSTNQASSMPVILPNVWSQPTSGLPTFPSTRCFATTSVNVKNINMMFLVSLRFLCHGVDFFFR